MSKTVYEGKCSRVSVVADSINPLGYRLTTLQLEYPRFIHAEFMTHRMFSRNASSSRAIPVSKLVAEVKNSPASPIHWGANRPGMQATQENDSFVQLPDHLLKAYDCFLDETGAVGFRADILRQIPKQMAWRFAAWLAGEMSWAFSAAGYHKQIANRLTEPYQRMRVICTATDWTNFFRLRCHPTAQPEIQDLASSMQLAFNSSKPAPLPWGGWHVPYLGADDAHLSLEERVKVSTARCARVSYLNHEAKRPGLAEDLSLHDRLVVEKPPHASPAEHQAMAADGKYANFTGWASYRWHLETRGGLVEGSQPRLL